MFTKYFVALCLRTILRLSVKMSEAAYENKTQTGFPHHSTIFPQLKDVKKIRQFAKAAHLVLQHKLKRFVPEIPMARTLSMLESGYRTQGWLYWDRPTAQNPVSNTG